MPHRRPILARLGAVALVAAVLILAPVVGAGLDVETLDRIADGRPPVQTAGVVATASEDGDRDGDDDDAGDDEDGIDGGDDDDATDDDDVIDDDDDPEESEDGS